MKNLKIEGNKVVAPDGRILGSVSKCQFGWTFIPNTSARRSSRKCHPTAEKAIPAWAKRWGAATAKRLAAEKK